MARSFYRMIKRERVKDKVVLITGGSRGLGLAIARVLTEKGAKLALCARSPEHLELAKKELLNNGGQVMTVQADVTDEQQVKVMIKKVIQHFGHIDILVNNAGMMLVGPDNVMDIADYKEVMDTNLWSSLYTIKHIVPHFRIGRSGHIVNICSIGGKIAVPHMTPYSVSKFALVGLSQGLNSELAQDNILVTTVIPNLMRTGSPRNITVKGDHEAEYAWFKLADSIPLISQSAAAAAQRIVSGIEYRETNIILTVTGKLAIILQALMPGFVNATTRLAGSLMPKSRDATAKKGYESESDHTAGAIGGITDEAAIRHNQL